MNDFGIKAKYLQVVRQKETIKWDVESARGFHNNNALGEGSKCFQELIESIRGHGEFARRNNISILANLYRNGSFP